MPTPLFVLAETVIDRLTVTAVGQDLAVPIDLAEPGQERALLFALVDACYVHGVALREVRAPPGLLQPTDLRNAEVYRGVTILKNPRDLEQIILVRG